MKLNPVLVQKALNSLGNAIYYVSNAIICTTEDVKEYNAVMKARQAMSAPKEPATKKTDPVPAKENLKALRQDIAAEARKLSEKDKERRSADPEPAKPAKPAAKEPGKLPDKPMKQAHMEEFLKDWLVKAKAHSVKSSGGFCVGMGCSYQGVEHIVKDMYSNGVVLLNRKATQYHRLVPGGEIEPLFLKDSGVDGKYSVGQKVEVGFGLKSASAATSFRTAEIVAIRGQTAQVKYLDTDVSSTARLSHLRPVKAKE